MRFIRIFKYPLYRYLLNLYPYKWIYKYESDKTTMKILVFLESFILFLTFWFTFPILLTMYFGLILYRKKFFKKIHYRIGQEFHKMFDVKKHKILGICLIIIYLIAWLLLLSLLFTIPILLTMKLGAILEKRRITHKKDKFIYNFVENEQNKKESKTIGYIND